MYSKKCEVLIRQRMFTTVCGNTATMAEELVCISDFENHAKQFLPRNAWDYYSSGANEGITLRENRRGFDRYDNLLNFSLLFIYNFC